MLIGTEQVRLLSAKTKCLSRFINILHSLNTATRVNNLYLSIYVPLRNWGEVLQDLPLREAYMDHLQFSLYNEAIDKNEKGGGTKTIWL